MPKVKLRLPKEIWTKKDTMGLAMNTLASIKLRTSKGLDADEQPFGDYSEKPIYISKKSGTGARLKPKGGVTKRGRKTVFYPDGYRQYKQESRSEEHTSELSHTVISYAVFCLKKKTKSDKLIK